MAAVSRQTPPLPDVAIEFVLDGDAELRALERRLALAEQNEDVEAVDDIHERFAPIGGHTAPARAASLLPWPVVLARGAAAAGRELRRRLNHRARVRMCRSHLLLLDEPTGATRAVG